MLAFVVGIGVGVILCIIHNAIWDAVEAEYPRTKCANCEVLETMLEKENE